MEIILSNQDNKKTKTINFAPINLNLLVIQKSNKHNTTSKNHQERQRFVFQNSSPPRNLHFYWRAHEKLVLQPFPLASDHKNQAWVTFAHVLQTSQIALYKFVSCWQYLSVYEASPPGIIKIELNVLIKILNAQWEMNSQALNIAIYRPTSNFNNCSGKWKRQMEYLHCA